VQELLITIRSQTVLVLHHRSHGSVRKREQFGLPALTDRLPSYWKVSSTKELYDILPLLFM
jgi:hypothetical protein